jgi:hypothetical protein
MPVVCCKGSGCGDCGGATGGVYASVRGFLELSERSSIASSEVRFVPWDCDPIDRDIDVIDATPEALAA